MAADHEPARHEATPARATAAVGSAPFCGSTEEADVGRKLHQGRLAAACLVVTVAAACGSSATSSGSGASPSASAAHGTLIVFGAGTLATPFTAEIAAFKKA